MEVPAKITIHGDQESGKALIGAGRRQMSILENLMRFQKLDQYAIKMSPYPGAVITCKKVFGLRTIEIVTSVGKMKDEPVRFVYGSIPLLVAGMYEAFSHGKTLISYMVPFAGGNSLIRAIGPTEHFTFGEKQFLQVRYLPENISDPDGATMKLIPSLALASNGQTFRIKIALSQPLPKKPVLETEGVVFDPVDKMDNGVDNLARVYSLKPGYKVFMSTTSIPTGSSNGVASVNYSADKLKVFVVYGFKSASDVITDYAQSPAASSTINYIIYKMDVSKGFGNISWSIESQGSYTVPFFVQNLFIDPDGKIFGPYKPYRVDGEVPSSYTVKYNCVTVDIFSGATAPTEKICVGNTVTNGYFAGIFHDMKVEFLRNPLGLISTYNDVLSSSVFNGDFVIPHQYESYYDFVGSTGGPDYSPPRITSGTYDSQLVLYSASSYDYTLWRSYSGKRYGTNCKDIVTSVDGSAINTVNSGIRTTQTAYIYGHMEQRASMDTFYHPVMMTTESALRYSSYLLNKQIVEDKQDTTSLDTVEVINGLVNSKVQGSVSTGHRGWNRLWDGVFGPFGTWPGTENMDFVGFSARGEYSDEPFGVDNVIDPENGFYPLMEYDEFTESSTPDTRSVKYPIEISNAIGATAFVAWDNNAQGLHIKGVRYTNPSDMATFMLKSTINDIDVSAKVMEMSGLSAQHVHYIGFLF